MPPTGAAMPPGWQYDITDPLGSLRTYMMQQGRSYYNPFNPAGERMLARMAASTIPHIYGKLLSMPGGDYTSTGQVYGDIIGEVMSGARGPMTLQGTAGILGEINSLIRQTQSLFGPNKEFNLDTPEGRAAMLAAAQASGGIGGLSVPQLAIAGALAGNGAISELFQQMYSPVLGPGLTAGLGRIVDPLENMWDKVYGPMFRMGTVDQSFMTLLDLLTGSLGIGR